MSMFRTRCIGCNEEPTGSIHLAETKEEKNCMGLGGVKSTGGTESACTISVHHPQQLHQPYEI